MGKVKLAAFLHHGPITPNFLSGSSRENFGDYVQKVDVDPPFFLHNYIMTCWWTVTEVVGAINPLETVVGNIRRKLVHRNHPLWFGHSDPWPTKNAQINNFCWQPEGLLTHCPKTATKNLRLATKMMYLHFFLPYVAMATSQQMIVMDKFSYDIVIHFGISITILYFGQACAYIYCECQSNEALYLYFLCVEELLPLT